MATGGVTPPASRPLGGTVSDQAEACRLLGPGDFDAAGIPGTTRPQASASAEVATCSYASSVELSISISTSPGRIYQAAILDAGVFESPLSGLSGVDTSAERVAGGRSAVLAAQRGRLVVLLMLPQGTARSTLERLAALVLSRAPT